MVNLATDKSLLVLQFNANGYICHINKLKNILHHRQIDNNFIKETNCTKYSHFHILRYSFLKVKHPDNTSHSNEAILIKSTLYFQPLSNYCHGHIQFCTIKMKMDNVPIIIGAFHSPPRHNITNTIFTDYFNTIKNNFIIIRDFNA